MEALKEALVSQNIIAWAILLVLFVLCLKLLKSAGKGMLLLLGILILGFVLAKFFPGVAAPIKDFVGGSWMN